MSEYNTNQDGQWKTSEQWRAEEANDHFNPKEKRKMAAEENTLQN